MTNRLALAGLWLLLSGGCAHGPAAPAWSDDSRSDLAAQGTAIDPQKESAPPQAASTAPPAPALVPAAATAPLPPAEDDAPVPPDAPVVRLLDAGAEPRTRLRYRLAGPQTEDLSMRMTTNTTARLGNIPAGPPSTAGARMLISVTAAPAGKGELTSTMRVAESDAAEVSGPVPGLTEKMNAELHKLVGLTTQARLTTRGAVIKSETSTPPDAPPTAQAALEAMNGTYGRSAILPAEAVGVGARWETELQVHQSGMSMTQVARYRVRELTGSRVGLDVEVELSAGAQEIKIPNAGGVTAQLEGMRGSGTGTLDLELGSLVPRRGHTDLDSQMSMRIPAGGQSMSVSMQMKVLIDLHAGR